jgi:hypothetical protein
MRAVPIRLRQWAVEQFPKRDYVGGIDHGGERKGTPRLALVRGWIRVRFGRFGRYRSFRSRTARGRRIVRPSRWSDVAGVVRHRTPMEPCSSRAGQERRFQPHPSIASCGGTVFEQPLEVRRFRRVAQRQFAKRPSPLSDFDGAVAYPQHGSAASGGLAWHRRAAYRRTRRHVCGVSRQACLSGRRRKRAEPHE